MAQFTDSKDYTDITMEHLESFAKEGFRTLVLAYRVIGEEEYQVLMQEKIEKY